MSILSYLCKHHHQTRIPRSLVAADLHRTVCTHPRRRVDRPLLPQRPDRLAHGHRAPVGIPVGVDGLGRRVLLAHEDGPRARLDAVAAEDRVRLGDGAVLELHQHLARADPVVEDVDQLLVELRQVPRQQLAQLVQEPRAADDALAQALLVGDGEQRGQPLRGHLGHGVDEVEPDPLLGVPLVARRDDVEGAQHAPVDQLHGLDGVPA